MTNTKHKKSLAYRALKKDDQGHYIECPDGEQYRISHAESLNHGTLKKDDQGYYIEHSDGEKYRISKARAQIYIHKGNCFFTEEMKNKLTTSNCLGG